MGLIGANYRIRAIIVLFLVLFLLSIIALSLTLTITSLQPSSQGFIIPADSTEYVFIKFYGGHTRIMTACVSGLSVALLSDAVGTVFGLILLKRQIEDQQLQSDKYAPYLKILYLLGVLSTIGNILALGHQSAIIKQLKGDSSAGETATISILSLSLILNIVIISILVLLTNNQIPESTVSSSEHQQPNYIRNKITTLTNSAFFHSNNPLRAEQPDTYISNRRERKYVKTTKLHHKRKTKEKKRKHKTKDIELNNVSTTKEPLIIAEEPNEIEAIKQRRQIQQIHFDESESDSIDAPDYPIAVHNSSMSNQYKQKVPKLKMELIKPALERKSSNPFSLNKLQISDIMPVPVPIKAKGNMQLQLVIDPHVPAEQSQRGQILNDSNTSKMPEQRQRKRMRPDLSKYICNKPSSQSRKIKIDGPRGWVKSNFPLDQ